MECAEPPKLMTTVLKRFARTGALAVTPSSKTYSGAWKESSANGEHHSGALHREGSQMPAEWIMAEELHRLGWAKQHLTVARKSDPNKPAIAARLRKET